MTEDRLDQAERDVYQCEIRITRQEQIVLELRLAGHSTALAEDLLRTFQSSLASHRSYLNWVRQQA